MKYLTTVYRGGGAAASCGIVTGERTQQVNYRDLPARVH